LWEGLVVEQECSITTDEFQAGQGGEGPCVLVIESHTRALHSTVLALEEAGIRVCACSAISAAEQALRCQQFDAIVVGMIVEHLFVDELLTLLLCNGAIRSLSHVAVLSNLGEETTWSCLDPETLVQRVLPVPPDQDQVAEWRERLRPEMNRPDSRDRAHTPRLRSPLALVAH